MPLGLLEPAVRPTLPAHRMPPPRLEPRAASQPVRGGVDPAFHACVARLPRQRRAGQLRQGKEVRTRPLVKSGPILAPGSCTPLTRLWHALASCLIPPNPLMPRLAREVSLHDTALAHLEQASVQAETADPLETMAVRGAAAEGLENTPSGHQVRAWAMEGSLPMHSRQRTAFKTKEEPEKAP